MPSFVDNGYDRHLVGGLGVTLAVAGVFDLLLGVERRLSTWFYSAVFIFVTIVMTMHEVAQIDMVDRHFQIGDILFQEIGAVMALGYVKYVRPYVTA